MQGFLIAAYKDDVQLKTLIHQLKSIGKIYVNINLKSKLDIFELDSQFEDVIFVKKYKNGWGTFSHLYAILSLLQVVLEYK